MKKLQLIGIKENKNYKAWKVATKQALEELNIDITLNEVNNVEDILQLDLSAIPALIVNQTILLEQNNHIPDHLEISKAITQYLNQKYSIMKNITVPTDFSDTAHNAFDYACELAKDTKSKIDLVNVSHMGTDLINGTIVPHEGELINIKKEALSAFVDQHFENDDSDTIVKNKIKQKVVIGYAAERLVELSKKTDMLVMGTTGKNGPLEKMFGSVSSNVSQNAACPVWLIPPQARYRGIRNILYASNYDSSDQMVLRKINAFADIFEANIHLVHVNETKNKGDYEFQELVLEEIFRKNASSSELRMGTIHGEKVWESLYQYANNNDIDLIVMAHKHRNFWERIRHKSVTKKMVLNAQIPLLVLHINK